MLRLVACLARQELVSENAPLALTKDSLDRMMMARLLDPPEQYPQWPLDYLIGCYGRVSQEIRALTTLKDKEAADATQLDLQYCKQLITRNAGLLLTMALFPQVTHTHFTSVQGNGAMSCSAPVLSCTGILRLASSASDMVSPCMHCSLAVQHCCSHKQHRNREQQRQYTLPLVAASNTMHFRPLTTPPLG